MKDRNKVDYAKRFNETTKDDKVVEEAVIEEIFTPVEEEPKNEMKLGYVAIKENQTLNLRADKSSDAPVVKTLSKGEQIVIDTIYEDWYRVVTESGAEGYVMSQYIEEI